MRIRGSSVQFVKASGLALCILLQGSGCWWQQQSYTTLMKDGFLNFEKRAERDRLLGVVFHPPGEFSMWIRPPNPTSIVETPEQFLAWFQGSDAGGPLIEVILMGSRGAETLAEFQTNAYTALKAAQKFPPQDPEKVQEPQTFTSMHDNSVMTFDLYQGAGQRQIPAAGGAAANPIAYQWLVYFGEEQAQKIMVCFIIPDSKYSDFQKALTTCMESLALAGKVQIAQQGGGGGAPAGGGGGANF